MKESLNAAKLGIIERWITAHGEMDKFYEIAANTITCKYGDSSAYDLKNYKKGKITSSRKTFKEPQPNEISYGKYGFDKDGFLTTAEIYNNGQLAWLGFFIETPNLIEYLQFSIEYKVPCRIQRVFLENGNKILSQSATSNGLRGFYPLDVMEIDKKVNTGFNDGHSVICIIEEYHYEDGKITRADCLDILPGIGEEEFEDHYIYDRAQLLEIKRYYTNGNTSITYRAPSGKSLQTISDELAEMFCDHIISILKKQSFDSPLFSVELSYRYCDNYYPNPVIITGKQKKQAVTDRSSNLFIQGKFITVAEEKNEKLERLYTEFYLQMETKEKWGLGRKMLIQTAQLLANTKLKGVIPVTKDFIVFPIEWELEWDEFERILLKCGVPKANVKLWKQYRWI